ncbi:beta-lactamase family protein [Burkholderia sp. Nafp2/4-1b]|uniref:beta-lactamase family protein n=1 Tax=Burkholderia sp. Nafp2/4-1b TaxID=2116686 RepID=UPI001F0941AE|nr:beta-lactamase family protein [Burkholderia sp. Nafp2/4-1b]
MAAIAPALAVGIAVSACGGDSSVDSGEPAYATGARPQINAMLADTLTPGAVVYVQSPHGNWLASFGTAVRGSSTPIPTNAHFRIGSVTKTWTGPDGRAPANELARIIMAELSKAADVPSEGRP